ncbi:hypothetical protein SAMN06296241_3192 [Salinimicrobium sediminis]|uniref:Uncharacterized protein n=1 Tax=Salinimicrobium sediminis TaxID=1343891 RepID=A0A285X8G3_9FLAO|nr:hypothetical protein [Salinimicrobium sediminis]SOC81611.1 hypothetical protein SAMN06296241_3192 [Salinimicrobium sediminis]
MKVNLLPHYWKMIATGIFVLAMGIWFINVSNPELLNLDPFKFSWTLKIIILSCLLLFVSTKEKDENERISRLRSRSLSSAVIVGVLVLVMELFMEILFLGKNAEITTGYELMIVVLLVYYLSFYIKKNIKTVKRG